MTKININAVMADNTKSISDRVKIAILFEAGFNNPDPSTLDAKENLSDYNFDNDDFINITGYFNKIIVSMKPTAKQLLPAAVSALTAVQDCIDIVNNSIK